ncbi:lysosomal cholesterol signaling protein-like isoform X1 [Centruroides vittatus]|uniref:lysosomal cholesterol signaling protein-like isoform X1 n=1 Tax=Centruroides vittatus TaxID=120091 RepID=UPI0035101B2E
MRPNIAELSVLYQSSGNGEALPWCKLSNSNVNSTHIENSSQTDAFDQLLPTLIECFVVVLCGYIAGKLHMIVGSEIKGLSRFASEFSLPALIFLNLITIDLIHANWSFVIGVLIGKLAIFFLVAIVTLIVRKPFNLAICGLYAIFCTQGNDFGLAYPIITSLYGSKYPYYPGYMYLIAPISLIILNPIGFLMMEIEKFRSTNSNKDLFINRRQIIFKFTKMIFSIIWEVLTNPNVLMTLLGVLGNIFLRGKFPDVIIRILEVLSMAFEATVLFLLGFSILGIGSSLAGAGLLVPGILLAVKMLASPLIIRATVQLLCAKFPDVEDLANYGFLYGMVPTGPIVLLFANQYNLPTEVLSATMVVCTFLTGPLMFVLAKMVTMHVSGVAEYAMQMSNTLLVLGILGLLASIWVCVIIIFSGRWKKPLYCLTLSLTSAQILMSIGLLVWYGVAKSNTSLAYIHIALITGGHLAARSWTAILAAAIVLFAKFPNCLDKILRYCLSLGFGIPIIIMIVLIIITGLRGHLVEDKEDIPVFLYGNDEAIASSIVLSLSFVITLSSLVLYYRQNPRQNVEEIPKICIEDNPTNENVTDKTLIECTQVAVYKLRKSSTISVAPHSSLHSCTKCKQNVCDCGIPNFIPKTRKVTFLNIPRSDTSSSMNDLLENEEDESKAEQPLRHIVLIILLFISMSVGLTISVWKLISKSPTGMFVAVEFLDVVLNFGQGIFSAVIFGTDIKFIFDPIMKMQVLNL